jgi:3-isopropylmalate/(R)-2-methylmalate dehydratase small subunit
MQDARRIVITGRAVPVRGNDIDTDRIIPARYLRTVVFEGLGEHAFEDDRRQLAQTGQVHPFDDPRYSGARILLANKNFGCGSSREHAPQALMRWQRGIRAVVGESFAEIFYGNCLALGIPCARITESAVLELMAQVEREPTTEVCVNLEQQLVEAAGQRLPFDMAAGVRHSLLEGRWDSTTELLANQEQILATARGLGYLAGFR